MIFEGLSEKLQNTLNRLKGKGKLNENDVKEALKEVKMALLEADVNYKVVKDFVSRVEERAVGKDVMESLTPGQQVIKIVNEELSELMGKERSKLEFSPQPPTVIMLCGLQGSGKTTTAGKLAKKLAADGKQPLLAAGDIYRPAAIDQLQQLGEELNLPVFSMGDEKNPVDIVRGAISYAQSHGRDTVILDTAGRLHVDREMMQELEDIEQEVNPAETLLVVDAMTGQDAVNVARDFDEILNITGLILTKLDGDARGGAALSIKTVTGKPVKFVGNGEKLEDLEPFYPERMASRILGMGDVLSLIEKAEENIDQKKAQELEEKIRQDKFSLDDFLDQMDQVRNMGSLDQLLGMIPGLGAAKQLKNLQFDEQELDYIEAIINSMTEEEKQDPDIINGSRRKRIARGSGTSIQQVNRLLKQFDQTKKMMKKVNEGQLGKGGKRSLKDLNIPFMGN